MSVLNWILNKVTGLSKRFWTLAFCFNAGSTLFFTSQSMHFEAVVAVAAMIVCWLCMELADA